MNTTDFRGVQPNLFGPRFQRMSQEEMVDILEPHFPVLHDSVMGPWEELVEYRTNDKNFIDMKEGDCAVWLTMQSQIRARSLLDGKPGFHLFDQHQKLVIVIEEKIAVTIKKLTYRQRKAADRPRLERSNYSTPRNVKFWDQRRDSGIPDYPRVILGYELLKEITEVRLVIAYSRSQGKHVDWAYVMPPQPSLVPVGFTPQLAPVPMDDRHDDLDKKGFSISEADTSEQAAGGEVEGTR